MPNKVVVARLMQNAKVFVSDLKTGQVFLYEGEFWMRGQGSMTVNLHTGLFKTVSNFSMLVLPYAPETVLELTLGKQFPG